MFKSGNKIPLLDTDYVTNSWLIPQTNLERKLFHIAGFPQGFGEFVDAWKIVDITQIYLTSQLLTAVQD